MRGTGLVNAGYYAIDSLRTERGFRAWGSDLTQTDTLLEAGLGFAADFSKDFLGKSALITQKLRGLQRRLVYMTVAPDANLLWGGEPIFRDGCVMGFTTSGNFGWSLNRGIALVCRASLISKR